MHRHRKWGELQPPPVKNVGRKYASAPSIQQQKPLICFLCKHVKNLQQFSLKFPNMLHQIASKDPQIFKNFPKGKGTLRPDGGPKFSPPPPSLEQLPMFEGSPRQCTVYFVVLDNLSVKSDTNVIFLSLMVIVYEKFFKRYCLWVNV